MIDCPQIVSIYPGEALLINNEAIPELKRIEIDTSNNNAIDFRLLACYYEKPRCGTYLNPSAQNKLCQNKEKYAHVYYMGLQSNTKHYLVVFVKNYYDTNSTIEALNNSINQLDIDINTEKTFFNIVIYGNWAMDTVHLQREYEIGLKDFRSNNYKTGEKNCSIHHLKGDNLTLVESEPLLLI